MIFFPYQIDIGLKGLPIVTYLLSALCILVFLQQKYTEKEYRAGLKSFCRAEASSLPSNLSVNQNMVFCIRFFHKLSSRHSAGAELKNVALELYPEDVSSELVEKLDGLYLVFERDVPEPLTKNLHFDPQHASYETMVTSALAHGDWEHLVFNLVFFFAFAVSAELVLGSFLFFVICVASCITTSVAYSYGAFGFDNGVPTIGLSGVVMSIMSFVAVVYPHKKMRVFYWVIFYFGVFRIPLLALVALYVGMDIYGLSGFGEDSNINYLSHVSGSATGAAIAMLFLFYKFLELKFNGNK